MGQGEASSFPLALYGRFWALHQLVPFCDKILGLSFSAMDNRMLMSMDFLMRLPFMILVLIAPLPFPLVVSHIINIVSWAWWMPRVWDYMVWCAITEMAVVCVLIAGVRKTKSEMGNAIRNVLRPTLIILYFSAAYWKLTRGWFDIYVSCAPTLMAELFSTALFQQEWMTPIIGFMMKNSPAFVAGLEFAVPTLLWLKPKIGVLVGLIFHQTINLMPVTYAGEVIEE